MSPRFPLAAARRAAIHVPLFTLSLLAMSHALAAQPDPAPVRDNVQHPAVLLQRDVTALRAGIDANRFIVAHPARLALTRGHANGEHPAVLVARANVQRGLLDQTVTAYAVPVKLAVVR